MSKKIEMPINNYILSKLEKPIRNKNDVIILLLETMNFFLAGNLIQNKYEKRKVIIYVDKMSRIIYELENKIFSINFPFLCQENNGILKIKFNDYEINEQIISKLMIIIYEMKNNSPSEIIETLIDSIELFDILNRLITYEYGYIRYDYDFEHANGNLHPLNHLDINYLNTNQYKLGLDNKLNVEQFIDILDLNTDCYFLHKNDNKK